MPKNDVVNSKHWKNEQEQWSDFYRDHLIRELEWSTQYIQSLGGNLSSIEARMGSLLALLNQAHFHSEAHAAAVKLIEALHPWPMRWEHWQAWEFEIRFAIHHFEEIEDSPDLLKFQIHLANLLYTSGRMSEALTACRSAIELAEKIPQAVPLAEANSLAAAILNNSGNSKEAEAILENTSQKLAEWPIALSEQETTAAKAYLALQQITTIQKDSNPLHAVKIASGMLDQLENAEKPNRELIIQFYKVRGQLRRFYGDYPGAAQDLEKTILLLSRIGDKQSETFTRSELGTVYLDMSNFDQAEKYIRESINTCERINARWQMISSIGDLARIYLSRGQLQQALTYFNRQHELAESAAHITEVYRAQSNRGSTYLYLKQYSLALKDIRESLKWYKTQKNLAAVIAETFELGMCLTGLGDYNRGQKAIEDAYESMHPLNIPNLQIFGRRCLAQYRTPEKARELLFQAMLMAQKYKRRLDEAGCLLSLSTLTENQLHQIEYWNQGKAILQEIGASTWLDSSSPQKPPLILMSL